MRAVAENFRGADALVVAGVIDPAGRVAPDLGLVCRLHASPADVRTRLLGRGDGDLNGSLAELAALERRGIGLRVDTSGLTRAEVADRVAERTGWLTHPRGGHADPPVPRTEPNDVEVHLITGPPGVGTSTVGWLVFERIRSTGITAGYIDLDQLGFCPPGDHRVKAANLAAVASTFRGVGASVLVLVGHEPNAEALASYAAALGTTRLNVHRLRASREELTRRILGRHDRPSWPDPGDRFNRQPLDVLQRLAAEVVELEATGPSIDTTSKTAEQVVEAVLAPR